MKVVGDGAGTEAETRMEKEPMWGRDAVNSTSRYRRKVGYIRRCHSTPFTPGLNFHLRRLADLRQADSSPVVSC